MIDFKEKIKTFYKSDLFIINILCFIGVGTSATLLLLSQIKNIYLINPRDATLLIIICLIIWFMENRHKEKKKGE